MNIAFFGFGEAGRAWAETLAGHRISAFDIAAGDRADEFDTAPSAATVTLFEDPGAAVAYADLIFCAVTASQSLDAALGVHNIQFFDLGDYPLEMDRAAKFCLVDVIRAVQPDFMLSHSREDPYNADHAYATQVAIECRMIAQARGHNPGDQALGAPQPYLFEPRQTERMNWASDTFLDITPVWDKKSAPPSNVSKANSICGTTTQSRVESAQSFPAQFRRTGGCWRNFNARRRRGCDRARSTSP